MTNVYTRTIRALLAMLLLASMLLPSAGVVIAQTETETETETATETATPADKPAIELLPSVIETDRLTTVTGSGWPSGTDIAIKLEALGTSKVSAMVALARAGADGNFSVSFFFAANSSWRQVDSARLEARDLRGDSRAAITVDVAVDVASAKLLNRDAVIAASISTPVATGAPVQSAGTAHVTGDWVNIRQGPSTDYPVLLVAEAGTALTVSGQNSRGDWLRVLITDGREGWILRAFTDFAATVPTVATPPLVTATPTPVVSGWRGEYFNNRSLSGDPVLVRDDAAVKFDWGFSSPAAELPADDFSARWTRSLSFAGGAYLFSVRADDGVRIWIDNDMVVDLWRDQSVKTHEFRHNLSAGSHLIRIDYYENSERAEIDFWWERVNDFVHEPGETFIHWRGEYFANRTLSGLPTTERDDASINFRWGEDAPMTGLPRDNFSVRWTRSLHFAAGLYRFRVHMDDGLRLYVDGVLIIDQWLDGGVREIVVDRALTEGTHTIRIDYYERSGDAVVLVWWERIEPGDLYPDWKGEYWANDSLSGSPTLVRNDNVVNFDWKESSPGNGIPADRFSARWTRSPGFESGVYRFFVTADDGVRLWVDDRLLIDDWRERSSRELVADLSLSSGRHDLRVEYFERQGNARIQLRWEKVQQSTTFPDWKGEYFANQNLRGDPVLVRNDAEIAFNWGTSAPAPEVGADRFSVRWTRSVRFRKGTYRFYARVDDGIRVHVGNFKVLDRWEDADGGDVYIADIEVDGTEKVTVEYYEHTGGARVEFWWQQLK